MFRRHRRLSRCLSLRLQEQNGIYLRGYGQGWPTLPWHAQSGTVHVHHHRGSVPTGGRGFQQDTAIHPGLLRGAWIYQISQADPQRTAAQSGDQERREDRRAFDQHRHIIRV